MKSFKERLAESKEKHGSSSSSSSVKKIITDKICPFMSSSDSQCACTEQCKFYRADQKNFECYFMEMRSISYRLKQIEKTLNSI